MLAKIVLTFCYFLSLTEFHSNRVMPDTVYKNKNEPNSRLKKC